jgi:hypothetical protein
LRRNGAGLRRTSPQSTLTPRLSVPASWLTLSGARQRALNRGALHRSATRSKGDFGEPVPAHTGSNPKKNDARAPSGERAPTDIARCLGPSLPMSICPCPCTMVVVLDTVGQGDSRTLHVAGRQGTGVGSRARDHVAPSASSRAAASSTIPRTLGSMLGSLVAAAASPPK